MAIRITRKPKQDKGGKKQNKGSFYLKPRVNKPKPRKNKQRQGRNS